MGFTTNRHVRVQVKTLDHGLDPWDVAWVMAKYVDASNQVYGLIHTNGLIELAVLKNGIKHQYCAGSQISWSAANTMDIDIVGNKAYVYVNGVLYLPVTDDWLDDFGGFTAFYSHTDSTAEFDDITVTYSSGTYYDLTVLSGGGGSTSPYPPGSTPGFPEGTVEYVTAVPNSGYVFDYWLLDGQPAGSNPTIAVTMNQPHTLQANFREGTTYRWLTVDAINGYTWGSVYPTIYIDGIPYAGYVHMQVTDGWHSIWVDEQVWDDYLGTYVYLAYFTDGLGNGENRPVFSDRWIEAVYY